MKTIEQKKHRWNYVALAFAMPTTIMLVLLFITSAEPFGSYTLLYSDMYHQYYPFFVEYRQTLRSGGSLLWNWSVGAGMEYLGLLSYYLASPLNLLSVLVPDGWVLSYFSLLMPIKLGLASGFFALMLKKLYGQDDWALTLFGSFYGMCAWALGYQWNIMWLDTFALLPLVVLGTILLLRDKKYVLYTISLTLAVMSNYYIGFFVCIFVFLLFFCYELCRFRGVWRFVCDLTRIGVFTVLALGMTAILELPTLAALQDTYSSVNKFPEGFSVNIVSGELVTAAQTAWKDYQAAKEAGDANFALWWSTMKQMLPPIGEGMKLIAGQIGGGQKLTYIDGMPNLYCGVFPVALGCLFLLCGRVKLRDKFCCVSLLVLFMLSFLLRQLDYIWHGFHFTNQIPYRFSFLFSFVLLYMAYRAWLERDSFAPWQILAAGALSVALLLADETNRGDMVYLAVNFVFLGLYLLLLVMHHPEKWRLPRKAAALEETAEEAPAEALEEMPDVTSEELPVCSQEETDASVEFSEETQQIPVDILEEAQEEIQEPVLPFWQRWLQPPKRCKLCAVLTVAVMTVELVLHVANFAVGFSIYDYDYPKGEESAESMFAYLQEREAALDFFRTEVTHAQTLNDGALNGYNGLSTFSSSANVRTTQFMEALGYAGRNNWNRYCWEEASPVANLFLNLRYMVERDITPGPNSYFEVLHSYRKITLMENKAYLPLGFLAETDLQDVDFSETSTFTLQNKMFKAATGLQENVWMPVSPNDMEVTADGDVQIKLSNVSGYTSFQSQAGGGRLTYTYTMSRAGFMCLDLTLYANKNFSVWYNGTKLYTESYSLPQSLAVCDVQPGDTVEVIIECAVNADSAVQVKACLLDEAVFWEGYEILKASTLSLTEFSNTYIAGVIDCNRDGLLYTSIPQCGNERTEKEVLEDFTVVQATTSPEGNWTVYVDGVKAENVLVGDAMIAVELTEGIHTVEFRYENKAYEFGKLVSFGCAGVFGGIVLCHYLVRRKKKEIQ